MVDEDRRFVNTFADLITNRASNQEKIVIKLNDLFSMTDRLMKDQQTSLGQPLID
jgi:hypothetical protein